MKKISLFFVVLFAFASMKAQEVADFATSFPAPEGTGNVVFPAGSLPGFEGGLLQAFINGAPVGPATDILSDASAGPAIYKDYTSLGDVIDFYILHNDAIIVLTSIDPPITWVDNLFQVMTADMLSFSLFESGETVAFGCTDSGYTEYDSSANLDDGSCSTAVVLGCMESDACNYNADANTAGQCDYIDGICDTCEDGVVVDNDADNDGVCDADEITGCTDDTACNYDSNPTTDTDNSLCEFPTGCETCSGELDGSGTIVDNDADDDGVCDADEVPGCMDGAAYNYDTAATDDDGSCYPVILGCTNPSADNYTNTGDVQTDANTDDGSCEYSGINPWGPGGGSEVSPTYVTGNNMSVLIQADATDALDNFQGINVGDVLFVAYETSRLENAYLGYSEVNGMNSAGAVVWTGANVGLPVFGALNEAGVDDNGFEEGEALVWLIEQTDESGNKVIRNATVLDNEGNEVTVTYENGDFAVVKDIVVGTPFYDGCMDPTSPSYNPLATNDDNSCDEPYSIGCMDMNYINYAGPDANPTHDNANNFGDPYANNVGYNLNTDEQLNTNSPANFSDDSFCQAQVEGCTDPMALNYDPLATQNDDTVCDWDLFKVTDDSPSGMVEYDVDPNGNSTGVVYNFGHVDPENVNDGIINSDFDRAQQVLAEGGLMPENHVIDNLSALMEWVDMDEDRDERDFFVNDSTWSADYDTLEAVKDRAFDAMVAQKDREFFVNDSTWASDYFLNDSTWSADYDTLEAVKDRAFAAMVAQKDFTFDSMVVEKDRHFFLNDSTWSADYDTLEAVKDRAFAAMVAQKDAEYDALMTLVTGSPDGPLDHNIGTSYYHDGEVISDNGIIAELQSALDYHASAIEIDLGTAWNTVGYYLHHKSSVALQFERNYGGHSNVANAINIVKNNIGEFYWPEYSFDGLGELVPGQGYQVRVKEESGGMSDFKFYSDIDPSLRVEMTPTIPQWAIDMEVMVHPNDIRTLVRVINMLGQEVNPADQNRGEVLLYMFNDGTVEKKLVQ